MSEVSHSKAVVAQKRNLGEQVGDSLTFIKDDLIDIKKPLSTVAKSQTFSIAASILLGTTSLTPLLCGMAMNLPFLGAMALPVIGAALPVVAGGLIASLAVAGGIYLIKNCADIMMKHASALGKKAGWSDTVVGTVLGVATSAPEMAVVANAGISGGAAASVAANTITMSNILNPTLILGLPLMFMGRMAYNSPSAGFNLASMGIATAVFAGLLCTGGLTGPLGWAASAALLGGLGVYMFKSFSIENKAMQAAAAKAGEIKQPSMKNMEDEKLKKGKKKNFNEAADQKEEPEHKLPAWGNALMAGLGLTGLVLVAGFTVTSALTLASIVGLPSWAVGGILALGSSAPEMATVISAKLQGKDDIAIGNIISSNIFNLLGGGALMFAFGGALPASVNPLQSMTGLLTTAAFGLSAVFTMGALKLNKGVGRLFGALGVAGAVGTTVGLAMTGGSPAP